MKFITILFLFWATSAIAAKPILISFESSDQKTTLYEITNISILKEFFNPKKPLDSFLELNVTGVFEANACGYNSFSFKKTYRAAESNSSNEKYFLTVSPLKVDKQPVGISEEFCTSPCLMTPFTSILRLNLNTLSTSKKNWEYVIQDADRNFAEFKAEFGVHKGWTFSHKKLEIFSCSDVR